jgi:hypothetical protein
VVEGPVLQHEDDDVLDHGAAHAGLLDASDPVAMETGTIRG